jgi:4-amino-4-deoxy-L-arabinose transferase-like glycosyltransferase
MLLAAAVIPYFVNLGVSSIWDANEAFYAQTPREMMAADDLVMPSFNFQLRMNKPVLSYWNVAMSYRLFGVSEWSERLPIALGGMVMVATAFGLARLTGGNIAGLFAAIILASSPRLMLLARRIIIDIHLAMWTGLILLCFALAESRPARRRLYLSLMYVAAGFGVLTKGPVAVFLPALVFLVYLAWQKRLGDLRRMMLPMGAVISLAIASPWYYMVYRSYGWDYIGSFIFGENLGRYTETVGEQSRGLFFYIPVMLADIFPWSFLLPAGLWCAVREGRIAGDSTAQARVTRLLLIWVAAIVGFFSLSSTKEDLYVLPIVTAEAALIGWMLARAIEDARGVAATRWGLVGAGALLTITGAATLWLFTITGRYTLSGATLVGMAGTIGGVVAVIAAWRRQLYRSFVTVAASLAVVVWSVAVLALPDFERYKPVRPFSEIIRSRASVGAIVGSYRFALPSMVYYLQRPIMEVLIPDHLRAVFYSSSDIYFVMPESEYEMVKGRLPVKTYVLARQPMFDLKPRNFLGGTELPQFVLVSNRPGDTPRQ